MRLPETNCRIGIISDTHGVVRREAVAALSGVSLIIHAGDVGRVEVLEELSAIAPVVAVRGNVDKGEWAEALPETEVVEAAGLLIYIIHDLHALDLDPAAAGFRVVVSGHSHQAVVAEKQGVLFLNPGSAGPRRFRLPVTLALLEIREGVPTAEIMTLMEGT